MREHILHSPAAMQPGFVKEPRRIAPSPAQPAFNVNFSRSAGLFAKKFSRFACNASYALSVSGDAGFFNAPTSNPRAAIDARTFSGNTIDEIRFPN